MVATLDGLKGRDFTRVADWTGDELERTLDLADELKEQQKRREQHHLLPGRTLGMIFQKPSTRTRVSFEVGIAQLGGEGLYLAAGDLQLGRGETIKDTANVLSRYLDAIMIRTFAQADVEELAEHASVPVINGLTDAEHPREAAAGADVLYTDVWTSMGQEEERQRRLDAFRGFTLDSALVSLADDSAI